MKYEVEFQNNIGERVVFDVEAQSEEQARDNAYDEMEGEGFNTDDTMADGYFLKFIEEK
ncbi:hypothetical protein [Burkholderia cenocepacia]|uniref:hypothetical protein n=1 Tax=Burkholderia cenocepacia TaxID=95486 RepID=UPI00222F2E44|nr:hypothetical protein [Burkholderia cenocepacia]MCW3498718.1 hypothetical protein [Burkholderia cenocepacia]MCW3506194.1 hypothetical protein [Burkholderia cenocepacia]MCW3513871.1 hypothetical protein [Burkholderia cenocepacia]MCW3529021.1 hypothetical protein [Burkholderia cenocepacia]MCW3544645.1 hypothetical protein [Burkholderia cenocepacia]